MQLAVPEHPELAGKPVLLDLTPTEVEALTKQARDVAIFEVRRANQEPARYALDASDFDQAAHDKPMADLSREAPEEEAAPQQQARRRGQPRKSEGGGRARPERDFDMAALCAWARSNNVDVPQRGRIPQHIVDQYKEAGN